jgi:hypothetical protein
MEILSNAKSGVSVRIMGCFPLTLVSFFYLTVKAIVNEFFDIALHIAPKVIEFDTIEGFSYALMSSDSRAVILDDNVFVLSRIGDSNYVFTEYYFQEIVCEESLQ